MLYLPPHGKQIEDFLVPDDVIHPSRKDATACGVPNVSKFEKNGLAETVGSVFQKQFSDLDSRDALVQSMTSNLQGYLPQLLSFLPSVVDQHVWERGSVEVLTDEETARVAIASVSPFP